MVSIISFFCWSGWGHASDEQTPEILRQQQREHELRSNRERTPDARLPANLATPDIQHYPKDESPCFIISRISLAGEESSRFEFALNIVTRGDGAATNRCLGVQGINTVLSRVQNAIISEGYVTTRVLAAPQDLKSGMLELTIIPGRVHDIRFTPDSSPQGRIRNALPANPGDLLNLRDIEQALENLRRPPTTEADIQIEPSRGADAKPGDSDLVIRYRQSRPFRLSLSADDGGSMATGKHQGALTLSGDNLLTLNDLFYFNLSHDLEDDKTRSHGTRGHTVHYSLPYGYWMLSATVSKNHYHQTVAGLSQNYVYSGDSGNAEIKLSRLIYRDTSRKTNVSLMTYLKTTHNHIDGEELHTQNRRMSGWQANLTHREFIGHATVDLDIAFQRGTGMLNARRAIEEDFGEGTARPKIISADASLNLPLLMLGGQFRYTGNVLAQWNRTPLIPQDRFSIGGRYTVRGFDGESILSAEHGWLIRNTLGLTLGDSGQELYLGVDYGHVGGPTADLLLGNHLAGAIGGLRGGYKGIAWDLFAGGPLDKPDGFRPSRGTAGFNLSWTY